jgi:hypothetical protein
MGKKHLNRLEETDSEDDDPEMDAEMQAVQAIMKEKKGFKKGQTVNPDQIVKSSGYNKEALLQSVEEMGTLAMPFEETYIVNAIDLNTVTELDGKDIELDDLEREMAFYNHSVAAVIAGRTQLDKAGIPHRRPLDFFCEHFKNDLHMARVSLVVLLLLCHACVCVYIVCCVLQSYLRFLWILSFVLWSVWLLPLRSCSKSVLLYIII